MKVYVIKSEYAEEGSTIDGVYSSLEKALQVATQDAMEFLDPESTNDPVEIEITPIGNPITGAALSIPGHEYFASIAEFELDD